MKNEQTKSDYSRAFANTVLHVLPQVDRIMLHTRSMDTSRFHGDTRSLARWIVMVATHAAMKEISVSSVKGNAVSDDYIIDLTEEIHETNRPLLG